MKLRVVTALLGCLAAVPFPSANAQEKVLNLYSARHYQTDEALYANFTKQTGIRINRIEGKEDELLERIKNEGANSPADVFITVDAARLEIADSLGLFAPVKSKLLEERIPAHLRTPTWMAFSTRARVIVYNKVAVKAEDVQNYEDLANPALKGQVCSRSGSHPYNLSLAARPDRPRWRSEEPKNGRAAWWPTSRARPRAAIPTRSRPSPPANAA
jgi:iron(III) transport system substrate-binding protein